MCHLLIGFMMSDEYTVYLLRDGIEVAKETNHVDYLSAEQVGIEWYKQNPDSHSFLIEPTI